MRGRKREHHISERQSKAALGRLEKGKTSLIAESRRLGIKSNGPLRNSLQALLGVEKYNALIERHCPRRPPNRSKPPTYPKPPNQCPFVMKNGDRCKSPKQTGMEFCVAHLEPVDVDP